MKTTDDVKRATTDHETAERQNDEALELTLEQLSQVGGARDNLHHWG